MQQYDKLIIGRGDYTLSFYKKVVYKESGTTKTIKKKKEIRGLEHLNPKKVLRFKFQKFQNSTIRKLFFINKGIGTGVGVLAQIFRTSWIQHTPDASKAPTFG